MACTKISTRHTNTGHRLALTPPRSPLLSTGTQNPGNELEPLHDYATYTYENLGPDLRSRKQFHTSLSRTPRNWTPQCDRNLHHGHTAFCTWLTIEDVDVDILQTNHTRSPHSHTFLYIIRATPAPHPYMF